MVHIREIPLSAITLTADEESGHFSPSSRRQHHPASADLMPSPQSVRYAWPSMSSRPYRHLA